MKIHNFSRHVFVVAAIVVLGLGASAQRTKPKTATSPPKPIIFAVLSDGATLEPIAHFEKGKLVQTVDGGDDSKLIASFSRAYYKPGTRYNLIFGSSVSGSVEVKSSDPKSECFKNMAVSQTRVDKTPLKGLVMGLATNIPLKSASPSFRRRPTATERDEVEKVVRAEYSKQKLAPETLRYHNLTALDPDHDGKPELVGSYWVEIDKVKRGLLFFIAEKGSGGKYSFAYHEYRLVDQGDVMSGDIKSVDDGVYHELLLDAFDYDGDGKSEVFTYTQSFEGAGFNVYRRDGGKWTKEFEESNYHCAF